MDEHSIIPANENDAKPIGDRLTLAAINALRSYEYGNASPDLAKDVADRLHAARGGAPVPDDLIYPEELTPALEHVLGKMCFELARYAHLFRAAGANIRTHAEEEQAYCLHWLVKLVLRHGDRWADHAEADLRAAQARIKEQTQ